MHRLYAPTQILRCTVGELARVILPPAGKSYADMLEDIPDAPMVYAEHPGASVSVEPHAIKPPPGSVRRVQILVPETPQVTAVLDLTPRQIGAHAYMLPVLPSSVAIGFDLGPAQFLTARAASGYAEVALVVEYLLGGD